MTQMVTHYDDDVEDLAVQKFYDDSVNKQKVWEFVSVMERRYYRALAAQELRETS